MIHREPIKPLNMYMYSESVDTSGRLKTLSNQISSDPALAKYIFDWYSNQPTFTERLIQGVTGLTGITIAMIKGEQPEQEIGYVDWETDQQKGILGNIAAKIFKPKYFNNSLEAQQRFLIRSPGTGPSVSRLRDLLQLIQAYDMQRYKLPTDAVNSAAVHIKNAGGAVIDFDIRYSDYHARLVKGLQQHIGY